MASGDIKPIATMGDGRQSTAPELPAVVETIPNLIAVGWVILAAPKHTPAHVITRLNNDLRKVVADPQLVERSQNTPFQPKFGDELVSFIRADQDRFVAMVQSLDGR